MSIPQNVCMYEIYSGLVYLNGFIKSHGNPSMFMQVIEQTESRRLTLDKLMADG